MTYTVTVTVTVTASEYTHTQPRHSCCNVQTCFRNAKREMTRKHAQKPGAHAAEAQACKHALRYSYKTHIKHHIQACPCPWCLHTGMKIHLHTSRAHMLRSLKHASKRCCIPTRLVASNVPTQVVLAYAREHISVCVFVFVSLLHSLLLILGRIFLCVRGCIHRFLVVFS